MCARGRNGKSKYARYVQRERERERESLGVWVGGGGVKVQPVCGPLHLGSQVRGQDLRSEMKDRAHLVSFAENSKSSQTVQLPLKNALTASTVHKNQNRRRYGN
jgi:hypothetical protein